MSAVVALAGHVDHGKSALVEALTGVRTDRLVHEAAARHTIEVHPAHLPGADVTLLDVPGHVDWLAATLAGFGAASHVLLVVGADDGVMPQTRDHLAAIRALSLPIAAVAVTRADTVPAGRLGNVVSEVGRELAVRGLPPVSPVAVVAPTGEGVPTIRARLATCTPPPVTPPTVGPDLWVDRSFLVTGRGRVVTGTLRRGRIDVGDVLAEAATGRQVRVRGLQRRRLEAAAAVAGDRVALLLAGGAATPRGARLVGSAIARDGLLGHRVDVRLVNLTDRPLRARGGWTAHTGTQHRAATVRPWTPVPPHGSGIGTLALDEPLPLRPGDGVVLRDTGRQVVAAGAVALSPARRPRGDPAARHVLADALAAGDPGPVIAALATCHGGVPPTGLLATVVPADEVEDHLPGGHPGASDADDQQARRARRGQARDALLSAFEAAGCCPPPTDVLLDRHGLDTSDRNHLARRGQVHVAGRYTFADRVVRDAAARLAGLPAPFTVAQARDALGVTRRHAVPLLELLDRLGVTTADEEMRRTVRAGTRAAPRHP